MASEEDAEAGRSIEQEFLTHATPSGFAPHQFEDFGGLLLLLSSLPLSAYMILTQGVGLSDSGPSVVDLDYKGVCHIALAQEGHCRPGEVLLGTDSHTCNAGACGQFATGIGNTDAGFVMGTGKDLLKVPPTTRFVLDGEMPPYLLAKDLILQIIGEISVSGATYRSVEFVGSTIESLTMEERMTLCNMVIEAGGKSGVVPADETTFKYLEGKTSVEYESVYSDGQARPAAPLPAPGMERRRADLAIPQGRRRRVQGSSGAAMG